MTEDRRCLTLVAAVLPMDRKGEGGRGGRGGEGAQGTEGEENTCQQAQILGMSSGEVGAAWPVSSSIMFQGGRMGWG